MTKYAVISDVHANYDALELVLKDAEKRGVDKIICLGDLVAKYFYPAEVVDAIKSQASYVVRGNCDEHVVTNEAFKFARRKLGPDRLDYLANLPLRKQIVINNVLVNLFHATPESCEKMFSPLNSTDDYLGGNTNDYNDMFISNEPQISFTGHTHQEYIGVEKGNELIVDRNNKEIILDGNQRAIINTGSIGEHDYRKRISDTKYEKRIDSYITYAIIDDQVSLDHKVHVQIISVPYKETLKKVYMDMVRDQINDQIPFSPNDTETIRRSLIDMGENEKEYPRVIK